MKKHLGSLVLASAALIMANAHAQVAVVPSANHEQLLASPDARLAANKRLVYDFWREVFEGGHMEFAERYMAEGYIQHNPNVPTGRTASSPRMSRVERSSPGSRHRWWRF